MKTRKDPYLLEVTEDYDKQLLAILTHELRTYQLGKNKIDLLYSRLFGPSPLLKRN